MAKLLFMSVLGAMIFFPLFASRRKHPVGGLKKALFSVFVFNAFYLVAVLFGYLYMHLEARPDQPGAVGHAIQVMGH